MKMLRVLLLACLLSLAAHAIADEASSYQQALAAIEQGDYGQALSYLLRFERQYPRSKHLATARTRISILRESVNSGEALPVFLSALALKDQSNVDEAIVRFASIAQDYPTSSLADDALYMSAYLQVMFRYDFFAAHETLGILLQRFAQSSYADSALYLDAIALEQMGDTQAAQQALIELRERHTALSLPLDFRWPDGDVLSRYWFDRADRRLAIVKQRIAEASKVNNSDKRVDGVLNLSVSVEGEQFDLLLQPSTLTVSTQWFDATLSDQLPPTIGIFEGLVKGVEGSWVRVVLYENSITGVINIEGESRSLSPANLIGTLDYYQPESRKRTIHRGDYSELATRLQVLDTLVAPPLIDVKPRMQSREEQSDIRAVPLSIVVDSQFDRYYAGAGLVNALNSLNVADGIYRQFGLALRLDAAVSFDDQMDPLKLGTLTLESILRSFREYRMRDKTVFDNSVLSYLFTGNPRTDVTLGLAWIDTLCRSDGYDVGVTTPSGFGDVLLVHEMGHSFGSQHDSDTQCADDQSGIMWPNISEQTGISFSSCSGSQIAQARNKQCLSNGVDLSLNAQSGVTSIEFIVSNPDSRLSIDVQLDVETSVPDQVQWPHTCKSQTPTGARCVLADLTPGEHRVLSLKVNNPSLSIDAPVTAQVHPIGLLEFQPVDNVATSSLSLAASAERLVSFASEEPEASASSNWHSTEEPVTGAAKSSGAVSSLALGVLLFLLTMRVFRQATCSGWPKNSAGV